MITEEVQVYVPNPSTSGNVVALVIDHYNDTFEKLNVHLFHNENTIDEPSMESPE